MVCRVAWSLVFILRILSCVYSCVFDIFEVCCSFSYHSRLQLPNSIRHWVSLADNLRSLRHTHSGASSRCLENISSPIRKAWSSTISARYAHATHTWRSTRPTESFTISHTLRTRSLSYLVVAQAMSRRGLASSAMACCLLPSAAISLRRRAQSRSWRGLGMCRRMRESFCASRIIRVICCILAWRERRARHWGIKSMSFAWPKTQRWGERRAVRSGEEDWLGICLVSTSGYLFPRGHITDCSSDQAFRSSKSERMGVPRSPEDWGAWQFTACHHRRKFRPLPRAWTRSVRIGPR